MLRVNSLLVHFFLSHRVLVIALKLNCLRIFFYEDPLMYFVLSGPGG